MYIIIEKQPKTCMKENITINHASDKYQRASDIYTVYWARLAIKLKCLYYSTTRHSAPNKLRN